MTTTTTTTAPAIDRPADGASRTYGLMAEFATPGELLHAAEKVRDAGYRWWDCHSPFPVHGLDGAMGIRPTILPMLVFGAGATGTLLGFILQAFTNATSLTIWAIVWVTGYPFLISGKPLLSMPAFIPVMFELTILLAATATVSLMLLLNGLPRLHHPLLKNDRFRRVTDDRFFIVVEARDPKYSPTRTEQLLRSLHPAALERVEE